MEVYVSIVLKAGDNAVFIIWGVDFFCQILNVLAEFQQRLRHLMINQTGHFCHMALEKVEVRGSILHPVPLQDVLRAGIITKHLCLYDTVDRSQIKFTND